MGSKWIDHKGKKILYTVYAGESPEKMKEILLEQADIIAKQPGEVLVIDDFRDAFVNEEFIDLGKRLDKEILSKKVKKNAVLGVKGIKHLLLKAFNVVAHTKLAPFETIEEAQEFLVKD